METKQKRPDRVSMPCQAADVRNRNFEEVALGYTEEMAFIEASRCLSCKKPLCMSGCPVEVPIRDFIGKIVSRDIEGAFDIITQANSFPAICGRVCPQENQCEGRCILGKKGEPVAIGRLERFVADQMIRRKRTEAPSPTPSPDARRVACIGSGPSSLAVAGACSRAGLQVDVYEAMHEAGGVLIYGIPSFRLPKDVVAKEIHNLEEHHVRFFLNHVGGRTVTVASLLESYAAVFIGVGAGLPNFLGIPGENLLGVVSANEYLTRINLGRAFRFPTYDTPVFPGKHVTVYGAGNVAMDAARTALRMGAESVHIVYRRTRDEMPARKEEIEHAEEEGVQFAMLSQPLQFIGNERHELVSVELQKMELGEPDASGRRRPKPVAGEVVRMATDLAVVALGTRSNPVLLEATPDLALNEKGYIVVNEQTGETSIPNVFAGGDIVTGAATVILAMGAGRRAAKEIIARLADSQEIPC